MQLDEYFKRGKVYVWKELFVICKSRHTHPKAFANIVDKDEITVIIDENYLHDLDVIDVQKGWKIFTLDIVFPMDVCGVTAKIASALAQKGISIMPLAAFSRDHFLIRNKDVQEAKRVFESLGLSL